MATTPTTSTASHPSPETLIEAGHDTTTLVEAAIRHIDRPYEDWSEDRRKALKDWKTWSAVVLEHPLLSAGNLLSEKAMHELLEILDRLFLAGTMGSKCDFAWKKGMEMLGETTPEPNKQGRVGIEMNTSPGVKLKIMITKQKLLEILLGILMHEVAHAYIALYACQGGCGNGQCEYLSQRYIDAIGKTGHARCWQLLAEALERQAKIHLSKGVDLRRADSAAKEYKRSGYLMNDKDVQKLFNGQSPLNDEVMKLRKEEIERQAHLDS
ncbi:hypothetical protein LTR85_003456 [Meristemomyces frigidus]|nr:hypothetical protein LTR85_003456 [Meristemomyces frigidus]